MTIVIVSIIAAIFALLYVNAANQRDFAEAQVNYNRAEQEVKDEFQTLTDSWGDRAEIDTLVSNNEWNAIKQGNMSADEMIAMAKTIETAYEAQGYSDYSSITTDDKFQLAVKDYNECKKQIDE